MWDELPFSDEEDDPRLSGHSHAGRTREREILAAVDGPGEEITWSDILSNYDYYISKEFDSVKRKCREGIPPEVRPEAWFWLSGGRNAMEENPNLFPRLMEKNVSEKINVDIKKDLHRLFPHHVLFADNRPGQKQLLAILQVYSVYNQKSGYCQDQGPVVGFILTHMKLSHTTFYTFVAICEDFLASYHNPDPERFQQDGNILYHFLEKFSPVSYQHLADQGIDPILFIPEWYTCVYTRTLPPESLVRVWDMVLCEGFPVILKVALALIKGCFENSSIRKRCSTMHESLEVLKNLPHEIIDAETLMAEVRRIDLRPQGYH
ncbi:TBC1 domain family member whacked-like [Venturia canescens]|uniref:TBC1 domain family member whacked-like n=1 Tax=Venturia canescens TaxID=32260 RepID=UPI001C9C7A85|nr:TBC1 domain family member whacked-like [Venturia canescens]